jgi:hypothetical protein
VLNATDPVFALLNEVILAGVRVLVVAGRASDASGVRRPKSALFVAREALARR